LFICDKIFSLPLCFLHHIIIRRISNVILFFLRFRYFIFLLVIRPFALSFALPFALFILRIPVGVFLLYLIFVILERLTPASAPFILLILIFINASIMFPHITLIPFILFALFLLPIRSYTTTPISIATTTVLIILTFSVKTSLSTSTNASLLVTQRTLTSASVQRSVQTPPVNFFAVF
jgi:hypothetical protein